MSRPVQRVGGRELDQAFLPVEEDERQTDVRISTFSPLNKFRIFLKKTSFIFHFLSHNSMTNLTESNVVSDQLY